MEFTEAQTAVLAAIVSAPRAWVAAAPLDPPAVAELVAREVVVAWTEDALGQAIEDGPFLTLTPWGAAALDVEIAEYLVVRDGLAEEVPRWVAAGRPPRPIRLPRRACEYRLKTPELVPDPHPGPEQAMYEGEPMTLLGGYPVMIDRRSAGKGKGKGKGKAKRGKGKDQVKAGAIKRGKAKPGATVGNRVKARRAG